MVDGTKPFGECIAFQSFYALVVCGERKFYWKFLKALFSPVIFIVHVYRTDISPVWDSLRLAPIIVTTHAHACYVHIYSNNTITY